MFYAEADAIALPGPFGALQRTASRHAITMIARLLHGFRHCPISLIIIKNLSYICILPASSFIRRCYRHDIISMKFR